MIKNGEFLLIEYKNRLDHDRMEYMLYIESKRRLVKKLDNVKIINSGAAKLIRFCCLTQIRSKENGCLSFKETMKSMMFKDFNKLYIESS